MPRSEPARRRPPGARRAALLETLRAEGRPLSVAELAPLVGLHANTVRAHLDVLVRTGEVSRRSDARNTPGRPRELYQATGASASDRNYRLLAQVLAGRLAELTDDPALEAVAAGREWAARRTDEARPTEADHVPSHGPVAAGPGDPAAAGPGSSSGAGPGNPSGAGPGNPSGAGPGNPSGAGPGKPSDSGPGSPSASGPGDAASGTDGARSGSDEATEGTTDPLTPVLRMLRLSGFAPELSGDGSEILLRHCPFLELAVEQPEVVCGAHLGLIQGALEGTGVSATRILPFVQPHVCVTELRASGPGAAAPPGAALVTLPAHPATGAPAQGDGVPLQ